MHSPALMLTVFKRLPNNFYLTSFDSRNHNYFSKAYFLKHSHRTLKTVLPENFTCIHGVRLEEKRSPLIRKTLSLKETLTTSKTCALMKE